MGVVVYWYIVLVFQNEKFGNWLHYSIKILNTINYILCDGKFYVACISPQFFKR